MLKRSRGRYTDEQVIRCAKMSGAFGKQIDRLFTSTGLADVATPGRHTGRSEKYKQDIAKFVQEYKQDALHDYLPVREHQGFKSFQATYRVRNARAMGRKLYEDSKRLDLWKRIQDREMHE